MTLPISPYSKGHFKPCGICGYVLEKVEWTVYDYTDERFSCDRRFLQGYNKEHPPTELIIHTDQGSQYTGSNFQAILKKYGAISSVSRKGNPYDNALMESFYKTIKRELIRGAKFTASEQTPKEIFKYIELYYNTKKMHSSPHYFSPIEYEKAYSS